MREIKFRIHDDGEMHYVTQLNIYGEEYETQYEVDLCDTDGNQEYFGVIVKSEELMQYTGLKDKNGIEIYEGDIIFWKDLSDSSDGTLEDAVMVFWDDEHLRWSVETLGDVKAYEKLYNYSVSEEIEVIGNIYENKEFMEG